MAVVSSEKIDLVVHGPNKPIVDNGFSDQFVLHRFETTHDLERLTPEVAAKVRGLAVTYNTVRGDAKTLARFPKLEVRVVVGRESKAGLVGHAHVLEARVALGDQRIVARSAHPDDVIKSPTEAVTGLSEVRDVGD